MLCENKEDKAAKRVLFPKDFDFFMIIARLTGKQRKRKEKEKEKRGKIQQVSGSRFYITILGLSMSDELEEGLQLKVIIMLNKVLMFCYNS